LSDSEIGRQRLQQSVAKTVTARLAVSFTGDPLDPTTWSGTPLGLSRGLAAKGVEVVGANVDPARALDFVAKNAVAALRLHRARRESPRATIRFARAIARASPEFALVRTWVGKAALRRAGPLDGIVQIGTGYSFVTHVPIVVFCDITVIQAVELGYPEWQVLSPRAVRARIDRQRRVYHQAVACCATTSWAADSIVRDYGVPRERVHTVGVGRNHSAEPADRDWSVPRFIWIGTDWFGKNGDGVLRAFARVRREHPEARLELVGAHPPIDAEGVTGHGFLRLDNPAQRVRMADLLKHATCLVLPSRYEAAAIAYVEAGAAGLPCIGTTVGGSRELIGDGGCVVDPASDDALHEAMLDLCDLDLAKQLGERALQRAPLFTWSAVAERVLRAFRLPQIDTASFAEFLDEPQSSHATASPPRKIS
jgi:glycosyltransferase involved in cell wall biosynthesis